MPCKTDKVFRKRLLVSLAFVPCSVAVCGDAWAVCNGGTTVTGALTVSASCDGGNVKPLTLDTGANVTINSGVTVSNDAGSGRNGDPVSVLSTATSSALTNNGIISTGQQWGVTINGTLTSLINTGTISSSVRRGIVINTGGTLTTLTNTGTITGPFAGVTNSGVALQTFNNQQGAGNVNGAVTYAGLLPVNYNIIIVSPTTYGKLAGAGVSGTTAFGIYGTSTVAAGTYTSVLTGLTTSNVSTTSGTFGGFNWLLSLASGQSDIWDLIFTVPVTNMTAGGTYTLATIGTTVNPVFDGGTLTLTSGASSSQTFTLNAGGGTITSPSGGTAQLSGVFSGVGGLTVNGNGILVLSGNNTYAGGTTVTSGTLTISGNSSLGTGPIFVASGGKLIGIGTLNGALTVAGTFKPGNSPGYILSNATVTMNGGSTYQQDIAGTVQAGASTPVGATGYYSFLNVANGQFVIQPNATLTPRLSNLFTLGESGFGSAPYTPVLGDRFRIVTANGGISGRFSALTQPAELAAGTQFIQLYNVAGSNSLDLALIPASYATTLAAQNSNARSVAGALDRLVSANQAGSATAAQDQLLYAVSGQTAATLPVFTRGLAGEVHGATLAVVPQTTLRLQQAVMAHLSDVTSVATSSGGSNPAAGSDADKRTLPATTRNAAWGDIVYQYGRRSGDNSASGFSSNLTQLIFGFDIYTENGAKAGGGIALANTNVSAEQGTGTVQQGSIFAYGKLPVDGFVLDGMTSVGLHSTDSTRTDPTGGASLQGKARGNDALISAGLSHPMDMRNTRVTPYARVTWQQVNQFAFGEGSSAAALNVNRFGGSGVRGMIGLTLDSRTTDPKERYAYRVNLALGADTSNLINPSLDASLAGMSTAIAVPGAGSGFVQAGFQGRTKFADNAFVYLGVSGEARRGALLGNVNIGVEIKF